jgi:hypothetical protein
MGLNGDCFNAQVADRGLMIPWSPERRPIFYFHIVFLPWVAAARQIVFSREQTAYNYVKSGVGIPDINQKDEDRNGYSINLGSRAIGNQIFTSSELCC